eukprot:COSAG02_NODE_6743_length_3389_cov_1.334347_1_plen_35_part_10
MLHQRHVQMQARLQRVCRVVVCFQNVQCFPLVQVR